MQIGEIHKKPDMMKQSNDPIIIEQSTRNIFRSTEPEVCNQRTNSEVVVGRQNHPPRETAIASNPISPDPQPTHFTSSPIPPSSRPLIPTKRNGAPRPRLPRRNPPRPCQHHPQELRRAAPQRRTRRAREMQAPRNGSVLVQSATGWDSQAGCGGL